MSLQLWHQIACLPRKPFRSNSRSGSEGRLHAWLAQCVSPDGRKSRLEVLPREPQRRFCLGSRFLAVGKGTQSATTPNLVAKIQSLLPEIHPRHSLFFYQIIWNKWDKIKHTFEFHPSTTAPQSILQLAKIGICSFPNNFGTSASSSFRGSPILHGKPLTSCASGNRRNSMPFWSTNVPNVRTAVWIVRRRGDATMRSIEL